MEFTDCQIQIFIALGINVITNISLYILILYIKYRKELKNGTLRTRN